MRIAITGATGLIGRKLSQKLVMQGHDLIVLSRGPETAVSRLGLPVEAAAWDAQKQTPLKDCLQGVDAVIHLAGESIADRRWTRAQMKKIHDSRVTGTRNLVQALQEMGANAPRILMSSSATGIYGDRKNEVLNEESTLGIGFLAEVCQEWEQEAFNYASPGRRIVTLRTGVVLSPDGGMLQKVAPIFRTGLAGKLGSGMQWLSWIHIDDMVAAITHVLETESLSGPINCTAPQPVSNSEFTHALAKTIGKPAILPTPGPAIRTALGKMAEAVLASHRVIPLQLEKSGFKFNHPSLREALESFKDQLINDSFNIVQWIPRPVSEVFLFFSDEKNLETITPPWLGFHVVGKSTPSVTKGTLIDYRLKLHGIPVGWKSEIRDWQPGSSFVDVQVQGPYKKWEHTHTFSAVKGGTLIEDRVVFKVPGGILGAGMLGPWIRKDIQKIFEFRSRMVREKFA